MRPVAQPESKTVYFPHAKLGAQNGAFCWLFGNTISRGFFVHPGMARCETRPSTALNSEGRFYRGPIFAAVRRCAFGSGNATQEVCLFVDCEGDRMHRAMETFFIECTGNGWENWKKADPNVTIQNTHGLVSTNEWTGVPLRFLTDLVGKDRRSTWMLAEGADAAGVDRSIPLTEEIMDEVFIAYGQNGEPLRPAHGFPIRLITPGLEGNLHIKWLCAA